MSKKDTISKNFIKNSETVPYQGTLTRAWKGALSKIYTKYIVCSCSCKNNTQKISRFES